MTTAAPVRAFNTAAQSTRSESGGAKRMVPRPPPLCRLSR